MRESILCLFVDDNEEDQKYFPRWIEAAWEKAVPEVTIVVEVEHHPLQAAQRIEKFDLLVCDLMWKKEQQPLGLTLIAEARRRKEVLAIVAVSDFGNEGELDTALAKGADRQVSKRFLRKDGADFVHFGRLLREAVELRVGSLVNVRDFVLRKSEESLAVNAMMEIIGSDNIAAMVRSIAGPDCRSGEVSYVDQGLSGAAVMNVDCRFEPLRAAPYSRSLLLKVSRNRHQMEAEAGRRENDGVAFPHAVFPRPWGTKPAVSDGWYGLGSEFVAGGRTFLSWVCDPCVDGDQIEEALEALFFKRNLASVWSETVRVNERPVRCLRRLLVGGSRGARILRAAEELKLLCERHLVGELEHLGVDFGEIRNFVERGVIGGRSEVDEREGIRCCRSHGDFHSRNLLRGGDGLLWVVDEGSIGQLPWPSDLARLVVDLLVSAVGRGGEEHEWTALESWADVAVGLLDGRLDDLPDSNPVRASRWVVGSLPRIFRSVGSNGEFPQWQFRLAVVAEFLRSAYRVGEVGVPKRVLGLGVGCYGLRSMSGFWDLSREGSRDNLH